MRQPMAARLASLPLISLEFLQKTAHASHPSFKLAQIPPVPESQTLGKTSTSCRVALLVTPVHQGFDLSVGDEEQP